MCIKLCQWILSVLLLIGIAIAVEPEQIASPRAFSGGVHYGLPGWVNIESSYSGQSVLPSTGAYGISLPESFAVHRSGVAYKILSIASDGRIVLGSVSSDSPLSAPETGARPHLIPTSSILLPANGNTSIPLKWYLNSNNEGTYTVIQVGPFTVSGTTAVYSYQVLVYTDGELQVQFWRHDGDAFLSRDISPTFKKERTILGKSCFYTGTSTQCSETYSTYYEYEQHLALLSPNYLREGWIAKSFDNDGVVFRNISDNSNSYVSLNFGSSDMPGALFAFDHSREHPVVGSFRYVQLEFNQSQGSLPVNVWYFNETIGKTTDAAYPLMAPNSIQGETSSACPTAEWLTEGKLYPCMYAKSWSQAQSSGKNAEWISAPAIKFQVNGKNSPKIIGLKRIEYRLRQPFSVQFRSPPMNNLEFRMGAGGYARVDNMAFSSPYQVFSDQRVHATIHAKPGQKVMRVVINGYEVFKDGVLISGTAEGDPQAYYMSMINESSDKNFEVIDFDSYVKQNTLVEVEFSPCTGRTLASVAPSYITTERFLDPQNQSDTRRKTESYAVNDGFGRVIQTQTKLGDGRFAIQGTYLDAFGRTQFAPLSFVSDARAFGYVDMACYQCIVQSDSYHDGSDGVERPDDYGYPYVESNYHDGEISGATSSKAGLGSAAFAFNSHPAQSWVLPAFSPDDFMSKDDLTDAGISSNYGQCLNRALASEGAEYLLNILTSSIIMRHN